VVRLGGSPGRLQQAEHGVEPIEGWIVTTPRA